MQTQSFFRKCWAAERPKVTSPKICTIFSASIEIGSKLGFIKQSKMLLLDRANRVLGIYELWTGYRVKTIVEPRMVFMAALKVNAASLILAHDHPSNNLAPSLADREVTNQKKSRRALEYLCARLYHLGPDWGSFFRGRTKF